MGQMDRATSQGTSQACASAEVRSHINILAPVYSVFANVLLSTGLEKNARSLSHL
jgi:hypothetical protein